MDSLKRYLADTFSTGYKPEFYGQDYLVTEQLYVRRAALFRMDERELKHTYGECLYSRNDTINISTSDVYVALEQDNHEFVVMALIQYLTDYFDVWRMYPCKLYVHESIMNDFNENILKRLFNGSLNRDTYFSKLPEREQRYVEEFFDNLPPAYLDKIVWMDGGEPIVSAFCYNGDIADRIIESDGGYDPKFMCNADVLLTKGIGAEYLYIICLPEDESGMATYLNDKQVRHINNLVNNDDFTDDFDILILHTPPLAHRGYDDYVYDLEHRGLGLDNYTAAIFRSELACNVDVALGLSDEDLAHNDVQDRLLHLARVSVDANIILGYSEDTIEFELALRRYDICTATVFNTSSDDAEILFDLGKFLSIGHLKHSLD